MKKSIIELKIEKLAGLGDGAGLHEGRKVFVPYTVAGDVIRARITRQTSDANYAAIEEILTPAKDRIQPVCRHFGICGGCTLQHINDTTYTHFKQTMAQEAIRKAGFDVIAEPIVKLATASRRRVELKAGNGKLGFYSEGSHNIVDIEDCRIMEPELLRLVLQMKKQLNKLSHITHIQINGVDNGYDILLEGKDSKKWQPDSNNVKRISVREGQKIQTIYQSGSITLSLGNIAVDIPPGAFLQASGAAQELMTDLVKDAVKNSGNVLDLFSGVGTYSFPVAEHCKVTAIEGDKAMVETMQATAQKYKISRLKAFQQDLFYHPISKEKLAEYDAVIINPPRAGAKAQSEQIASADIQRLVMVSCNPATFARDARILRESGFTLQKLTPIDQFVYSSHLELVAEFSR